MDESEIEEEIGKLKYQMSQTDDDEEKASCKNQINELELELEDIKKRKKQEELENEASKPVAPDKDYKDSVEEDEEKEEENKNKKNEEKEKKKDSKKEDNDDSKNSDSEKKSQDEKEDNSNQGENNQEDNNNNGLNENSKNDTSNYEEEAAQARRRKAQERKNSENNTNSSNKNYSKNGTPTQSSGQGLNDSARMKEEAAKENLKEQAREKAAEEAKKKAAEAGTKAAASNAAAAGIGATIGSVLVPIIVGLITAIFLLIIIIGIITFFVTMPGLVKEKVDESLNGLFNAVQSFILGEDIVGVKPENILEVAKYLNNMGYDLEGCGFLAEGDKVEFETDGNGNSTGELSNVESLYLWAYLVAENRTYLIRNYEFNLLRFAQAIKSSILELKIPKVFEMEAGLIHFDDFSLWNLLSRNIKINREREVLIMKSLRGIIYQDVWPPVKSGNTEMTYSLKGWTGRYGKPLEFLLSLHIATMAPDFVLKVALDPDMDAVVHVMKHTAHFHLETQIDWGGFKTVDEFYESLEEEYRDEFLPAKIEEMKSSDPIYQSLLDDIHGGGLTAKQREDYYDDLSSRETSIAYLAEMRYPFPAYLRDTKITNADGSESELSYQDVLDKMHEANNQKGEIITPYITYVEKHWFRNVYFKHSGSHEIVQTEFAEDRQKWDKYENGELVVEDMGDIDVYEENDVVNTFDYTIDTESSDPMMLLHRMLVHEYIEDALSQVRDGKRGITNDKIKELLKEKYYIYDGSIETAERIHNNDSTVEKKQITFTQDSLSAFSMLENTHTLDADYIYKDLKELLIELEYFEREDFIKKDTGVFAWLLDGYLPVEWPERKTDKEPVEYGTIIRSKSSVDSLKAEEPEGTIINTGFSANTPVIAPLTGKIKDIGIDEYTGEPYITLEVLDTPSIEQYEKYYYGEKQVVTMYEGTEDEEEVEIIKRVGYENVCAGYTLDIRGINVTTNKQIGDYVEEKEEIGKTTDSDICLIFRDLDNAIVENIEEYFYETFTGQQAQDVSDMFLNGLSPQEYQFFAGVLTAEAGGSVEGATAVAFCVYNRMVYSRDHNGSGGFGGPSLLGVLTQPGQFTTVHDNAQDAVRAYGDNYVQVEYNGTIYYTKKPNQNAIQALDFFLNGQASNPIGNRLFFHGASSPPSNAKDPINIGGNIFYNYNNM